MDRERMIQRRITLSSLEVSSLSQRMAKHLRESHLLDDAKHVALYSPVQGEIDPWPCVSKSKRVKTYLPRVSSMHDKLMDFHLAGSAYELDMNQYGIPEPSAEAPRISLRDLDVVLVPLVMFDTQCHRVGRGAGFYDITFGFRVVEARPRLIGLAYAFQEVNAIVPESWDVPLDAVVTEEAVFVRE